METRAIGRVERVSSRSRHLDRNGPLRLPRSRGLDGRGGGTPPPRSRPPLKRRPAGRRSGLRRSRRPRSAVAVLDPPYRQAKPGRSCSCRTQVALWLYSTSGRGAPDHRAPGAVSTNQRPRSPQTRWNTPGAGVPTIAPRSCLTRRRPPKTTTIGPDRVTYRRRYLVARDQEAHV